MEVAAATVEATAASNLFWELVSPGISSTDSDPSSLRRVIVKGFAASAAVLPGTAGAVVFAVGAVAGAGAFAGASPDCSCLLQPPKSSATPSANNGMARSCISVFLARKTQDFECPRERGAWRWSA